MRFGCLRGGNPHERFACPVLSLLLIAALAAPVLADGPAIGAPAPAFDLKTLDGKPFSLADAEKSNKAVVLMFIATKCPVSNAYNDRMRDIANEYGKKGILFVGINSNKHRDRERGQDARPGARLRVHAREGPRQQGRGPLRRLSTRPRSSSSVPTASCSTTAASTRTRNSRRRSRRPT